MKAGKMTNEELAHNLYATIPFLTKEARHVTDADEIMRESATRLLNQGELAVKDSEIAELRECLRLSSNAMEMVVQWLGKYPTWKEGLKNCVARNRKAMEEDAK